MSSRFRRGPSGGVIQVSETGPGRPGRSTRAKALIAVYAVLLVAAAVGVGMVAAQRASTVDLASTVTPSESPTPTPSPTQPSPTPTTAAPSPTATRAAARPRPAPPRSSAPAPKTTTRPVPAAKRATALSESGQTVTTEIVLGSPYRLQNTTTAKCLTSDGNAPTQVGCGSRTGQQWTLRRTRVADGATLYRVQHSAADQRCLDLPGNDEPVQTTAIGLADCGKLADSADGNDEWRLKAVGPPYQGHTVYALVNAISGLCLDVAGVAADQADTADDTNYTAYRCQVEDGTWDDHLWVFS